MRAFVAIDLPKELKEKIFSFGQKMTKGIKIKLVEKENLHLTLLFLGEIDEDRKDKIREKLGGLGGLGEIKLKLGKAEVFPKEGEPHGIWINVEGEKEKLFSLYKRVVERVLSAGIKLEEKQLRFSPHIALGRFKGRVGKLRESGALGDEFSVSKVTFFESQLTPKGPIYSKIGEFEVK